MSGFEQFISDDRFLPTIEKLILSAGVLLGIFKYKKFDNLHKVIFWYIVCMGSVELISSIVARSGNNLIVMPVYCLIDIACITFLYNRMLLKRKNKYLLAVSAMAVIFILWETLYYFVLNELSIVVFQPYMKIAVNFTVILYSLYFIYEKVSVYSETKWRNFNINIAMLVTYTLTTIFFLPFNLWINDTTLWRFLMVIIHILIISVFYSYLVLQLWKNSRKPKRTA